MHNADKLLRPGLDVRVGMQAVGIHHLNQLVGEAVVVGQGIGGSGVKLYVEREVVAARLLDVPKNFVERNELKLAVGQLVVRGQLHLLIGMAVDAAAHGGGALHILVVEGKEEAIGGHLHVYLGTIGTYRQAILYGLEGVDGVLVQVAHAPMPKCQDAVVDVIDIKAILLLACSSAGNNGQKSKNAEVMCHAVRVLRAID